jgi:protein-tyrosine phosphatase
MGWESVYRYGVRTLIDLRAPHESYTTPISTCLPPSLQGSLAYLNLPLEQHPPPPHILARLERAADRAETYAVLLTSYQPTVVMILRAIMLADPGGVIIFCRMGKDRTGMIAALLSGLSLTSF